MKTQRIYILLAATVFLVSCSEDFLNRRPLDQEVSSNFYQDEEDAKEALVAVYDAFGYQSTPGVSWAPFSLVSDILSDDAYAGGADANDGKDEDEINTFNIPTTNLLVHSIWIKNYIGVYRANLLLEVIDDIEASEEFKNRVKAECKFFRAYFNLELVRFFENIPLLTSTLKSPSEYDQSQNSPKEVYDQIALDLVEAIDGLPEEVSLSEKGRVTKWAASALLARTYLFYNGVYGQDLNAGGAIIDKARVVAYLEELIQESGHSLLPNYEDLFRLSSEFSSESILEVSYGDTPPWWDWGYVRGGEGNLAAQMQGPRVTNSDNWDRGWSFGTIGEKLVKDLEGDPRRDATILFQDELDGTLVKGYQHTGYYSQKYSSDAEHWGADGQFELNRTCNYRVIRYADVLLMAAELGSPNAQQYLDMVRSRVGLPSVPATKANILKERRLELSLEGIRYFDLLRQGIPTAAAALNLNGVRGPNYEGDQQIFDVTFDETTKGFLPIPQAEIDLSGGTLKQNTGY